MCCSGILLGDVCCESYARLCVEFSFLHLSDPWNLHLDFSEAPRIMTSCRICFIFVANHIKIKFLIL